MRRDLRIVTAAFAGLLVALAMTQVASAQFPAYRPPSINPLNNAINRPTVSPYLNLLQRSGNGMPTYQTLVRPMVEQRQQAARNAAQIQQLQQDFSTSSQAGQVRTTGESQQVRGTGHVSGFMNHMHFFNHPTPR